MSETYVATQLDDEEEYDADEFEDDEEEEYEGQLEVRDDGVCGNRALALEGPLEDVALIEKLSIRTKSPLDLMRDKIPKPPGSVPPTALPSWYDMPMYSKIPMLPAPVGYFYYSRGKLATPLHRCHDFYTVRDHLNLERVVQCPYDALHDPHAVYYLQKPDVKRLLRARGLINSSDEVLCSFSDFNKFRDYLRTHYNDELERAVNFKDTCWRSERDQLQAIIKSESNKYGHQAFLNSRRTGSARLAAQKNALKVKKMRAKQASDAARLEQFKLNQQHDRLAKVLRGYERARVAFERYHWVLERRKELQRLILKGTTIRDFEGYQRVRADKEMMRQALLRNRLEWIDNKVVAADERTDRNLRLDAAIRADNKVRALQRQKKAERYRRLIPVIIEKKKMAERRVWEIVRKYARRWLDKVRRRLRAPKDLQHESVWIGKSKGVLDDMMKYLKEISGYEKMDDFVLNIIRLKRQIQAQIEAEEAAEAAEAAANAGSHEASAAPSGKEIPDEFKNAVVHMHDHDHSPSDATIVAPSEEAAPPVEEPPAPSEEEAPTDPEASDSEV